MMKYCGISRWIKPKCSLPFHCLKQFLAAKIIHIKQVLSKLVTTANENQKDKEPNKPGWILQADRLPTHGALGASLTPTRLR